LKGIEKKYLLLKKDIDKQYNTITEKNIILNINQ